MLDACSYRIPGLQWPNLRIYHRANTAMRYGNYSWFITVKLSISVSRVIFCLIFTTVHISIISSSVSNNINERRERTADVLFEFCLSWLVCISLHAASSDCRCRLATILEYPIEKTLLKRPGVSVRIHGTSVWTPIQGVQRKLRAHNYAVFMVDTRISAWRRESNNFPSTMPFVSDDVYHCCATSFTVTQNRECNF